MNPLRITGWYWAAGSVADETSGAGVCRGIGEVSKGGVCSVVTFLSCILVGLLYLTGALLLVTGSDNTGIWQ